MLVFKDSIMGFVSGIQLSANNMLKVGDWITMQMCIRDREYSYRVSRAGTYETGLATMQCAYAPEYASHSASMTVAVKE